MTRRTLFTIITLALVIIVAIVGYVVIKPGLEASSTATTSSPAASSPAEGSTPPASSSGNYVEYSSTAIAEAEGTTLLFFHASWCPSCRQIESEINEQGLPDGVTVIKVDYDSHQDLRQKYGVTIQTTFVKVDSSGKELAKFVPYGGDLGLSLVLDELA